MRKLRRSAAAALMLSAASFIGAAEPVSLEVMIERVRGDLVARRNANQAEIRVISADSLVWRDASLGCGKPTESYAQIETEGFRVVLAYRGERFDYRGRNTGDFVLCTVGS